MKKSVYLSLSFMLLVTLATAANGFASHSRATDAKAGKLSIRKAAGPNALTVEQAYGDSAKLEGSTVVIRGKVVKVTAAIMDKNWIHIQDGTGSPDKGNYDLTCTTSEEPPSKDAVITVTGRLSRNRDFGAGYFYRVIMENATYKKK